MKEIDLFKQSSQVIETAESLIAEYDRFNKKYVLNEDDFFEKKLIEMGYESNDASNILINKDLLLSMFMNKFEKIEVESNETIIDINLEIEEARKKYIDAVDAANESIKAANEASELMLLSKQLIEKEQGTNQNDWDNKSIHEMNQAIEIYNVAVNNANDCVQKVKDARMELANVRKKYQVADKIKESNIVYETS